MPFFSIIICTYNPDPSIFVRLLNSISNFDKLSPDHEIIIVDNNSKSSIGSFDYIHEFIVNHLNCKLILEGKPGLTNARITGINEAKAEWIIFFDDDNEPFSNYLIETSRAISEYPYVGAWGPAQVSVKFIDQVDEWFKLNKKHFQQRDDTHVKFSNDFNWQAHYPYGTGLIIQKDIALLYSKRIQNLHYTLSDRLGNNLSSGGDVQLVLTCISEGKDAGIYPSIGLNHLITSSKSTFSYLRKLVYYTSSSYIIAFNQVFPEYLIDFKPVSNFFVIKLFLQHIKIYAIKKDCRYTLLSFIEKIGQINAIYKAHNCRIPISISFFEKYLIK